MPAIRRHWTTADVRSLMDEDRHWPRYELIGGELIVTPAPATKHQVVVAEVFGVLRAYMQTLDLGMTLTSPADLELEEGTITQPDVFVVPLAREADAGETEATWADIKTLLLAVEIISPSSARVDRITKRDYYLSVGVPEYWVVDLDARMIERWTQASPTPRVERGMFEWTPIGASTALVLDVAALFERIRVAVRRLRIAGDD